MSRSPFQRFLRELRRRHVPQTAAIYLVAAWAAIEFSDVVVPNLNGPQWIVTAVIVAALAGFPVMLVVAWIFEWGPEGIHRTEGPTEGMEAPPSYDAESGETEPSPAAGQPTGPEQSQPWLLAVAILIVGIGSALAVTYVVRGDGGDGARAPAAMRADTGPEGGRGGPAEPGGPDGGSRGTPGVPTVPQLEGLAEHFSDSVRSEIVRAFGAIDSMDLGALAEMGRRAAMRAGTGIVVSRPVEWGSAGAEPVATTLPEGRELLVEGMAFDTAGIVWVEVDGREVADLDDQPRRSVPFRATLVGRGSAGPRIVPIVARTADGREIRREYTIIQLPGGTP